MGRRENDTVYTSARGDIFYVSGTKVSSCYQVPSVPHPSFLSSIGDVQSSLIGTVPYIVCKYLL